MSITAYKRTISDTEAPRQIERRVLVQATADLERYLEFDETEERSDKLRILASGLRDAIWKNERIWLTFKHDLAGKENSLPPDLRANLISLAIWVEDHSEAVMKGAEQIGPLIGINRSIIRGLNGSTLREAE
ncbi:MAG: flaF protein [Rhodobacteraceae bacterium]|nr:MAG: flaF protein [Paracoccaceae bacterium]